MFLSPGYGWFSKLIQAGTGLLLLAVAGRLLSESVGGVVARKTAGNARWVQWSSTKPENGSGWLPLESSPTLNRRWPRHDSQNVPREHANCTDRTVDLVEVEVTLRLRASQSVCLGVGHPFGAQDQIFFFLFLLLENCSALRLGAPSLMRERVCNL
jgi:hypothetical protein